MECKTGALLVEGSIPEQKHSPSFPSVLCPASPDSGSLQRLLDGIAGQKPEIERQLELTGAVLFRGFDVFTAADFDSVLEALGWENFAYNGRGAHKKTIVGRVVTANEKPLHYHIGFHNEMSYQLATPGKVIFYCNVPPPENAGGATPIVPGHLVYNRLKKEMPEFLEMVESKGLTYTKVLCSDPSKSRTDCWQVVFQASTQEEAEKKALTQDTQIQWRDDGSAISIMGPRIGMKKDNVRARKVWFNSIGSTYELIKIDSAANGISFGDGTPLGVELMEACKRIMEEEQVAFKWEKGDVLVLENDAVLHAREPSKPPRSILAALCAKC